MTTTLENPYKILGVERTADERAIKKAYVTLVRKFSPEAHPEEFKKIRAAYELLSDADARARFDDSEKGYGEYGDDVSVRLAEADEAIAQKKPELAREILTELVDKAPEVGVVREKLGFVLLELEDAQGALDSFDALVQKEPENARHHLHCAFALVALERKPDAERALVTAHRLDPKDVRVALALADFYIGAGRARELSDLVDETVPRLEPGSPPVFGLLLRKVEGLALGGELDAAERTIEQVRALAAGTDDAEVGPFVAGELGRTAAKLFASKRGSAANRLLALCASFDPGSEMERPLPAKIVVPTRRLPDAFRTWLADTTDDKEWPFAVRGAGMGIWAFLLLLAGGAAIGAVALLTLPGGDATAGKVTASFLLLLVAFAGLVYAGRRVLRVLSSPLRSMTTLHPLYVVRVGPATTTLHPLFLLSDVHGVHQHTNGVYTGTRLTLRFGDATMGVATTQLVIKGQDSAQGWLDAMLQMRGRSLELLAEGCLEADSLVDLLTPGAAAALPSARAGRVKEHAVPIAIAAALALAVAPAAAWTSARGGEDRAFSRAAGADTIEEYRRFLDAHLGSRHRAAAEAAMAARYDRMIAATSIVPGREGAAALARAIAFARDHATTIDLVTKVDRGDDEDDAARVDLAVHVGAALGAAGLREVLGPDRQGRSQPRLRITVAPWKEGGATLAALPSALRRAGKEDVPELRGAAKPTSFDLYTKTVDEVRVSGVLVTLAVEVPDAAPFEQRIELPAVTSAYAPAASTRDAVWWAEVATLERAADAVTDALGLLGPAARFSRGSSPVGLGGLSGKKLPGVEGWGPTKGKGKKGGAR